MAQSPTAVENEVISTAQKLAGAYIVLTEPITIGDRTGTIYADTTNDQQSFYTNVLFTADDAYKIISISEVHENAATSADGVSLMVSKLTGTTAPTAATLHLLTDLAYNGSAATYSGFNLKAAINTVQNGTMTTTASAYMAAGDRLVYGFNGTLSTTGVCLTVVLQRTSLIPA